MEHDGWARLDNAKQVKCLKHVASGKRLLVIGSPMALLGERVKPAFALVSRATRRKLSRSFSFIFEVPEAMLVSQDVDVRGSKSHIYFLFQSYVTAAHAIAHRVLSHA